jgi:hypothetical protein
MQSVGHTFKITPSIKKEIVKIIDERIREAHVTKEDFSELKSIVRDSGIKVGELTEAQKRTEIKVEELAEAQKRTEVKVEELAEAQKRTEEEVCKLAVGLNRTREDLGGLSRSFSYAFENEAYRMLPVVLKEKYAIKVRDKVIRADIGGKEINFFAHAERDGSEIYIVGEAKTRLDDTKKREDVFNELEEKVEAVKEEYGEVEIVRLLVTHFATKGFLKKAEEKGVIVIQSFQW